MNRLFQRPNPGLSDYAALILFAGTFVAISALVVAPERFGATQVLPVEQIAK